MFKNHSSGEQNIRNTIISPNAILKFLQSVADMGEYTNATGTNLRPVRLSSAFDPICDNGGFY